MNDGLYSFNSTPHAINKTVWEKLPADLQAIMIEEGAKLELEALRIAAIQKRWESHGTLWRVWSMFSSPMS